MMKHRLMACVLGLTLAGAAAAQDNSERPHGDWIDGQWRAVSTVMGGQPNPTLTFRDDRLRFEFEPGFGPTFYLESRIVAVDETKSPAHLDLVFEDTNLPAEFSDAAEQIGKTIKAIYQVQGDLITLATAQPGSDQRPENFAVGSNAQTMVFTGKRVESDAEIALNPDLPAELAGQWLQIVPLVLEVREGLMQIKNEPDGEAFEQYELLALGFDAQGGGRLMTVTLESQNQGTVGRTQVTRVEFDGPDHMVTASYPPGHDKSGTWPESIDLNNVPAGMMVATWERIK